MHSDCDANNANANRQQAKITTSTVVCNLLPKCLHNVTLWGDRVAFSACVAENSKAFPKIRNLNFSLCLMKTTFYTFYT